MLYFACIPMSETVAKCLKTFAQLTAAYLVDDCQLVSQAGRRRLRSADIDTCSVPRCKTRGSATGVSQSLDHGSGTVCRPGFASPTTTLDNFVGS